MADNLTPEERRRAMAAVKSHHTTPERRVRSALHRLGYRFRLHDAKLPGRPDLVLPGRRLVIFVHGCYWHGHRCRRGARMPKTNVEYWQTKIAGNVARDRRRKRELKQLGWRVLVIWECRIGRTDFETWLARRMPPLAKKSRP